MEVKKALAKLGFGALACAIALPGLSPPALLAENPKPDIVVIMVDDHGYISDQRVLKKLPTIRRTFIQNGIRFTRMHAETPLCTPGRATFLTGQHTLHHGVYKNDGDLLDPRHTVAYALDDVGYETYLSGKYLNKYDGPRIPAGWDKASIFYNDPDKLVNNAANMLSNAPLDKPVLLWASSNWPHVKDGSDHPFVPERYRGATQCQDIANFEPPTYRAWKTTKPFPYNMPHWPSGWRLKKVCESMLGVDEMVRNIKQAQAERNRPVRYLFLSDNGMAWGQKGNPSKHVPHSTRIPFYVAGTGIDGGRKTSKLVSLMDIAPTLAQVGGASMPWSDGKSFLSLLQRRAFPGRQCVLETYRNPKYSWKALRCRSWHYIRFSDGERQLFKTSVDRWERWNRAKSRPDRVQEMNAKLNRELKDSRS